MSTEPFDFSLDLLTKHLLQQLSSDQPYMQSMFRIDAIKKLGNKISAILASDIPAVMKKAVFNHPITLALLDCLTDPDPSIVQESLKTLRPVAEKATPDTPIVNRIATVFGTTDDQYSLRLAASILRPVIEKLPQHPDSLKHPLVCKFVDFISQQTEPQPVALQALENLVHLAEPDDLLVTTTRRFLRHPNEDIHTAAMICLLPVCRKATMDHPLALDIFQHLQGDQSSYRLAAVQALQPAFAGLSPDHPVAVHVRNWLYQPLESAIKPPYSKLACALLLLSPMAAQLDFDHSLPQGILGFMTDPDNGIRNTALQGAGIMAQQWIQSSADMQHPLLPHVKHRLTDLDPIVRGTALNILMSLLQHSPDHQLLDQLLPHLKRIAPRDWEYDIWQMMLDKLPLVMRQRPDMANKILLASMGLRLHPNHMIRTGVANCLETGLSVCPGAAYPWLRVMAPELKKHYPTYKPTQKLQELLRRTPWPLPTHHLAGRQHRPL